MIKKITLLLVTLATSGCTIVYVEEGSQQVNISTETNTHIPEVVKL